MNSLVENKIGRNIDMMEKETSESLKPSEVRERVQDSRMAFIKANE
jgi:hypothetical protein